MRYFLATAIVLALFATSASAQTHDVIVPPLEYDRAYKGKLIISRIDSTTEVGLLCGQAAPMLSCSQRRDNECEIIMATDNVIRIFGYLVDVVLRHEIAHCNGWPQDHPGGIPYSSQAPSAR
jgi:hypothetical protein